MNISLATLNDYISENDFRIFVNHSTNDRSIASLYDENRVYSIEVYLNNKIAFYIHPLYNKSVIVSANLPKGFETWNRKFKRLIFKGFNDLAEWLHMSETKELAESIINAIEDDIPLLRNNLEVESTILNL